MLRNKGISDSLIPVRDAAEISGYHPDYVSALIRSGKVEGKKIGRNWFTTEQAAEKLRSAKMNERHQGEDAVSSYGWHRRGLMAASLCVAMFAALWLYAGTASTDEVLSYSHILEENGEQTVVTNFSIDVDDATSGIVLSSSDRDQF
jgi:hypothetical protein